MQKQALISLLLLLCTGSYGCDMVKSVAEAATEEEDYLPDNAPEGAIEYFESSDGKNSITLYENSVVLDGEVSPDGPFSINISDIRIFKRKVGNNFHIEDDEGKYISFNLDLFSRKAALRFEETMLDLIEEHRRG